MQRHRMDILGCVVALLLQQIQHATSISSSGCCFCGQLFRTSRVHRQRIRTNSQSFFSLSSNRQNNNHDRIILKTSKRTIEITESDFPGAGVPRRELQPHDIPPLLMTALQCNDFPTVDAGLRAMWEFSSFIFQHNITDFIQSAHDTARDFPTSFYGAAMNGRSYEMETAVNRVGGPEGWIATQVMKTISSDGRLRRWQWELRQHRRPPQMGCWYVESIGSSDRNGQFEPE